MVHSNLAGVCAVSRVNRWVVFDLDMNSCFIHYVSRKTPENMIDLIYWPTPELKMTVITYMFTSRAFSSVLFPQLWRPKTHMIISLFFSCFRISCTSSLSLSTSGYSCSNLCHRLSDFCCVRMMLSLLIEQSIQSQENHVHTSRIS